MVECHECQLVNRRTFLRRAGLGVGALAFADPILQTVASTFAQTSSGTGNLLVLCELNGGMDVLSFLAPFTNSVYQEKRPVLALKPEDVTPLPDNPDYGISNLFPFFNELYAQRQVAIVQQVAYPNGNGSHFESQEIYEYGVRNLASASATSMPWYERLRATYFDEPFGVLDTRSIGNPQRYGYPDDTYRQAAQDAFGRLATMKEGRNTRQQAVLDAYSKITDLSGVLRERTAEFESTGEARGQFFRTAQLASAKLDTQILRLSYGGFDTHGTQDEANQSLFPRINNEFQQFVEDLKDLDLWERTCIAFYTEFGRRNAENGSPGTDHGYGGHIILVGPSVNGGLHGQNVTSADLREDSLPYYVDFRAVFSSCIRDWLGFDPRPVFQVGGETYDENVGSSLFT
ncbi:MAG: DUF1501 domain-containing protein [Phycisphaerae bacterium]|nr:DUF1501 domain-containing protein [Phycisphaerae bacterium]